MKILSQEDGKKLILINSLEEKEETILKMYADMSPDERFVLGLELAQFAISFNKYHDLEIERRLKEGGYILTNGISRFL